VLWKYTSWSTHISKWGYGPFFHKSSHIRTHVFSEMILAADFIKSRSTVSVCVLVCVLYQLTPRLGRWVLALYKASLSQWLFSLLSWHWIINQSSCLAVGMAQISVLWRVSITIQPIHSSWFVGLCSGVLHVST